MNASPPEHLNAKTWKEAYEKLHPGLEKSKPVLQFQTSLKISGVFMMNITKQSIRIEERVKINHQELFHNIIKGWN